MREMTVYGVSFDLVGKQPIVLLKTSDGDKVLPVWIGHPEAASILMKLQGQEPPRPQTHDLLADVIAQLDAEPALQLPEPGDEAQPLVDGCHDGAVVCPDGGA